MRIKVSGWIFGILFFVSALLMMGMITSKTVRADEHPARLVDNAGLLTSDEAEEIEDLLDETSEEKEFDFVIVTTNSIDGYSEEMDYADDYYDYTGYGYGDNKDGVLFLVNMENNQFWISTTGYGIKAIDDETREDIQSEFTPYLSNGDYYKAFETFTKECGSAVSHARLKAVMMRIAITLVIALLAASIVCGTMKSQLKSVRSQAAAGSYVVTDSMHLTNQSEMFLYSVVNRVAKPKDNDKNGSIHTSSSGTSHGGGGGSF